MSVNSKTIPVMLVGAGIISRHHAHAALRLGLPVELHVADPCPVALKGFVEQFPDAKTHPSAEAMFDCPTGAEDIAIIATPPVTHAPLTEAALRSGRHVLCEKPLAMDADQAAGMLVVARQMGRHLACCSSRFLGLRSAAKARELLTTGALGEPYHLNFIHRGQRGRTGIDYQPSTPWFLSKARNGGGTLMDWGPYDFAAIHDMLDPVRMEVLSAWSACPQTAVDLPPGTVYDVEQHVSASLRYTLTGGERVCVTYERAACTHGAPLDVQELEGSHGAVSWDWLGFQGGKVDWSVDEEGKPKTTTFELPETDGVHFHDRPLRHLLAAIRGERSAGLLDERAVFNFACLRAIYDTIATGSPQVVTLGRALA